MTGFNDLPNELVREVWHHVLPPHDIASFALVSERVFDNAESFLKEYHRLKSKYSVIKSDRQQHRSILAHLLKDVLLSPPVALYVQELHICEWHVRWEKPPLGFSNTLVSEFDDMADDLCHLPYPEPDMDLFRNVIRKTDWIPPSKVGSWIKLLENGHEDPLLALLLSLLPNLCTLSLEGNPEPTTLFTTIRRIARTAPSKWLPKLKSIDLSGVDDDMSLAKSFLMLPSVEKISCHNLYDNENRYGVFDFCVAPQSSNVTELVVESCGGMEKGISGLLEGTKALKKFTYASDGDQVKAFWIRSKLHGHCRHSLEHLSLEFKFSNSNYVGTLGSLLAFKKLRTLHVERTLLVNPNVSREFNIGDLLPASIEAVYLTHIHSALPSHIRTSIRSLVSAKRTRLLKLGSLGFGLNSARSKVEYRRVDFLDMYQLCGRYGVSLTFHGFFDESDGSVRCDEPS